MKVSRQRGFTLVELLIVIAIIGILAELIAASGVGAITSAQSTACLSNLRQLGLASRMYADDWGGYMPPYSDNFSYLEIHDPKFDAANPLSCPDPALLRACLYPYVKDNHVWFCPLDKDAGTLQIVNQDYQQSTSYLFAYWSADRSVTYPPSVDLDSADIQKYALIMDAWRLPPVTGQGGPFTNHPDNGLNYVRGDLSAKHTNIWADNGLVPH